MTRFKLSSFSSRNDNNIAFGSSPASIDAYGGVSSSDVSIVPFHGSAESPNEENVCGLTPPSSSLHSRISVGSTRKHSVRLVTRSPDGRMIHSLVRVHGTADFVIESHRTPILEGDDDEYAKRDDSEGHRHSDGRDGNSLPRLIRTQLPSAVREALKIDPPLELCCLDGDKSQRSYATSNDSSTLSTSSTYNLPMTSRSSHGRLSGLCIYSRKRAFFLTIHFNNDSPFAAHTTHATHATPYGHSTEGRVVHMNEPFARELDCGSKSIIRLRPAPQPYLSDLDVAVVPDGSVAVLVLDKPSNLYSILLHHGNSTVTQPVDFQGSEEVLEMDAGEKIVDFCFAQSGGLSIFASMSILLLRASGELLAASPIVFHGTVIAQSFVQEGVEYLHALRQQSLDRNCALYRQCRAAEQYLLDVYGRIAPSPPTRMAKVSFCTANVLTLSESAAAWPVAVQGPLLLPQNDNFNSLRNSHNHNENPVPQAAVAIETFGSTDSFAGVAVAYNGCYIDFATTAPTNLIPRFAFESIADKYDLNEYLYKRSAVVERLGLLKHSAQHTTVSHTVVSLLRDPIVNHLLHFVTKDSVSTVSTNIMKIAHRRLRQESVRDTVRTTAWASITSTSSSKASVIGIAVCHDASVGHDLVARFSDGTIQQVNITSSQILHEMDAIAQKSGTSALALPESTTSIELSTGPLCDKIEPLITKITAGLANFTKLVGTETSFKDISVGALALAIDMKKRCDKEVVIPIFELKTLIDSHRKHLNKIVANQKRQLEELNQCMLDMKEMVDKLSTLLDKTDSNAHRISKRTDKLNHQTRKLLPTVTEAEYEYFMDIKRLNHKVSDLSSETDRLNKAFKSKRRSLDVDKIRQTLQNVDPEKIRMANNVLKGESVLLQRQSRDLDEQEHQLQEIQRRAGSTATSSL